MRLFTLCLLLLAGFALQAQESNGVVFQEKDFETLLADAKAQDKLIFIDAYTTWCGPCKMMTAKIFPQDKVGAVYNDKFINAKFDMEKGEGPDLAKRYNVRAYPTYLFVNGDGELVHKGLGYIPADELLSLATVAGSDQNLLTLSTRYENGDREAEFMTAYATTLTDVMEDEKANEVVGAYLTSLDRADWKTEPVMNMIMSNPGEMSGERFNFIMENAGAFQKMSSTGQFIGKIQNIIVGSYAQANNLRGLAPVADLKAHYTEVAGPMATQLGDNYEMIFAQRSSPQTYPALAVAYYSKYPSNDANELNSIAWNFYENVEDPNMLKTALGWAMESVRLEKQYMNMDTLAWLYKKMGMDEMARKTATEAIEIAQADGSDYSSTSPILED